MTNSSKDSQRILVVDDVQANLIMLEALLAQDGLEILKASSGKEAIDIASENELSLVLLDVIMPDMSGYEVAEALRGMPNCKYVPIIFVTASDQSDSNLFKSYESGAVDVLYKPIQPEIITSKVKIFLELDDQRRLIKEQSKELKEAFEKLQNYAQHDQLTGLFNRDQLTEILVQLIAGSRRYKNCMALFFLDLDHFKNVNDSLGHDVGDMLLQSVAERLRASVRESDFIARLGGDEFAVVLTKIDSSKSAGLVAQKILDELTRPHDLKDHEIIVSSSIGIAMLTDHFQSAAELLKAADTAMYQAKSKGRSQFAYFSPEMEQLATRRMEIARSLNEAIDRNELSIFYQPQISSKTSALVGFEALMRWRRDGEWISPALFIPIAEETGLIPKLGAWILKNACIQLKQWQQEGLINDDIKISINISIRQIQASNFLSILEDTLSISDLSPKCLELELTESTVMDDPEATISVFESIHQLGLEISVDDFGTGYSSLNYLRQLPIDRLKIDQSFVRDIDINRSNEAIVKAIIGLSHNLGLMVVAEGVETETQRQFLVDNHCDILQGYLIAKPIPAEEVATFIQQHREDV